MKKNIIWFILAFFLGISSYTAPPANASGPGEDCNVNYSDKYGSDYVRCGKESGASENYCRKAALCDEGLICVKDKCEAAPNGEDYFCQCLTPNATGANKNGFRCGTDANNIPANAPIAYCGESGHACIAAGNSDVSRGTITGKDNSPVPYPNNAKLKGIACQKPRAIAQCKCVGTGDDKKNNFECTLSDQPGVKGTGFCKESTHTCSTTANPEDVTDQNTTYKYNDAMDSGDYILKGIKCAQPQGSCKCLTPNVSGNRLNGFKCTQIVDGKERNDIDYCELTTDACIDDPNGQVINSNRDIFDGAPLKGVRCEEKKPLPPPQPPCAAPLDKGKCTAFASGFGTINTDAGSFISSIFALLLSISGGIALLLIIRAGYLILTSSGKPEQVNAGREQLIAAIVGLLFIIFSFVILEVIGIDILRLPDFTGQNQVMPGGTCTPSVDTCSSGYVCNYNGSTGQCVKQTEPIQTVGETGDSCGSTNPCGKGLRCNSTTGTCEPDPAKCSCQTAQLCRNASQGINRGQGTCSSGKILCCAP